MKVAIALLLVALSCSFDSGDANGIRKGGYSKPPIQSMFPKQCLQKLLKIDVPEVLTDLQNMLCCYMAGRKTHNQKLYKEFLCEVHTSLKRAGCFVDEVLTTPEMLEQVGDKAGEMADKVGFEIMKLVEDMGISDMVMDCLCKLLGETLKSLSQTLAGLDLGGLVSNALPLNALPLNALPLNALPLKGLPLNVLPLNLG